MKKITNTLKALSLAAFTLALNACFQDDNPADQQQEPEIGILAVEGLDATDSSEGIWTKPIPWTSNWNIEFAATFSEDVVILDNAPEGVTLVNVATGADVQEDEALFEKYHWTVIPGDDAKTVILKLVNEGGSLAGKKMVDEAYVLTVPAGIIGNVAGTAINPEASITLYTSVAARLNAMPKLTVESAQPTDFSDGLWTKPIPWTSNWNIDFTLTFAEDVVIANEAPAVKLTNIFTKADIKTEQFEAASWKVIPGDDAKSVVVKLVNAGGSVIGVKFVDAGYELTIPAGIITSADGTAVNPEITGTFYSSAAAIKKANQLQVTSVLPTYEDDGIWTKPFSWASNWNITFTVTFAEDVVILNEQPAVSLINAATNALAGSARQRQRQGRGVQAGQRSWQPGWQEDGQRDLQAGDSR